MCTIEQTNWHYNILFYFYNAPWVNFLHQNIFERLAYFGLKFICKGSSFWEFLKSLFLWKPYFWQTTEWIAKSTISMFWGLGQLGEIFFCHFSLLASFALDKAIVNTLQSNKVELKCVWEISGPPAKGSILRQIGFKVQLSLSNRILTAYFNFFNQYYLKFSFYRRHFN
jgi:hypothetical protein